MQTLMQSRLMGLWLLLSVGTALVHRRSHRLLLSRSILTRSFFTDHWRASRLPGGLPTIRRVILRNRVTDRGILPRWETTSPTPSLCTRARQVRVRPATGSSLFGTSAFGCRTIRRSPRFSLPPTMISASPFFRQTSRRIASPSTPS